VRLSKKSKRILLTVAALIAIASATVGFFMFKSNESYEEKSKVSFSMGTVVTVKIFGDSDEKDFDEIAERIDRLDKEKLTNKNSSSLVSQVNSGKTVSIDSEMYILTKNCLEIYSATNGKASLSVGALSSLWDFDSLEHKIPSDDEIKKNLKNVDDSKINLTKDSLSVSDGIILDFGSSGKGAACDEAAKYLEENKIDNAVISVGGSIFAKGHSAKDKKINVAIRNPYGTENEYFGYISTDYAFISTSGNYEKAFTVDGKKYHHLLDCTTGYPVEGELMSVSVICDNGAKSDALSTACFVLGYGEESLSLLKKHNARAIFVFEDRTVYMSEKVKDSFTLTDESFSVKTYED